MRPDPTDGVDAYIWDANETTNYGTDDETWVARGGNNTALALFRFNMGALPAGVKILNANLSVYQKDGNDPNLPVTAHRITNPWSEDFVTWRRRDSGINWDSQGGDFDATVIATTEVGAANNTRYEWDITALAEGWVNGTYPNNGVALVTEQNGAFGERFYTSDRNDPTERPSLSITYACECGTVCMAPQGSGNLLLVIGSNPFSPNAEDVAIRDYLESWGYTVTLINDDEDDDDFDDAVALNDVVFVSESVNAGDVGNKLTNAPIGVVSAEGQLNDELGIASGRATPVGDTVDVVDNSHYITRVFPPPAAVQDARTELQAVSGSIAAGCSGPRRSRRRGQRRGAGCRCRPGGRRQCSWSPRPGARG